MPKHRSMAALAAATLPTFLLLAVGPARALDLSGIPIAFAEDFQGETSSPTTPEYDLLGTGGVTVDGTFTGSAAYLEIVSHPADVADTVGASVDTAEIATNGSDIGLRSDFTSFSLGSNGEGIVGTLLLLDQAGATVTLLEIAASVSLSRTGATYSGELGVGEFDLGMVNPDNDVVIALSPSDAAAIGGGADFRIDLRVDHTAETAVASLEIGGVLSATTPVLSLSYYDDPTLSSAIDVLTVPSAATPGTPLSIEQSLLQVHAQAETFRPWINIDVSNAKNVPSSSFAAAGGAGFWNIIGLSPVALDDVNGNASGATVDLDTASVTIGEGFMGPDIERLMDDYAFDCFSSPDEWSMTFSGLPDGDYRVYVYAPGAVALPTETADIDINGTPAISSLPGNDPPSLVEGVSWGSAEATVSGGTLTIEASTPTLACAGVAGVQLARLRPVPKVPSAGLPALLILTMALGLTGTRAVARR